MKIRNGFVSNSSSSSFIVIWDKKPESVEEVQKILFGDSEHHNSYGVPIKTEVLARTIFHDTNEASLEEIEHEQRGVFSFEDWGSNPCWYSVGYKPNEELMVQYAKEMIALKVIEDECYKIMRTFTSDERKTILRKFKLERILDEGEVLSEREKLFIDTERKHDEARERKWGENSLMSKIVKESTDALLEDFKDKFIAVYDYGDDNTIGSCIEHQGCFDNLTNWRISHH